ncbi:MAG: hypothetical protein JWL84_1339 [Rhodospirillales bacterium]|nr:hypothetical protein [Rhodospirillales bacterium]
MANVFFEPDFDDDERRTQLYAGAVLVYGPRPAARALCGHAAAMIEEAFAPHDPRRIDQYLPVEECVARLARLKPAFIHHPRSKELIQHLLGELGCDADDTYFDVPRMRSAMPGDYLTSGIAYAFHPHRDTWYSAPQCQLNWWLPIYPIRPGNSMAFHPRYFVEGIPNTSRDYNYYRWNAESRANAAQHVKTDTRIQPHAEVQLADDTDLRLLCPPGGIILFSAAQLHSTVPNTSGEARYSIDFRTVHCSDAAAGRGAPNQDSACTGTTMRDYLRASDLSHLPDEIVGLYDDEVPAGGAAVFSPA